MEAEDEAAHLRAGNGQRAQCAERAQNGARAAAADRGLQGQDELRHAVGQRGASLLNQRRRAQLRQRAVGFLSVWAGQTLWAPNFHHIQARNIQKHTET